MIVIRPRQGERIPVTEAELSEINKIFDNSASKWTKPDYVSELFKAASSKSNRWVFLRSEGWHQLEKYGGDSYLHVTVNYNKWTYHCYTKVTGRGDSPKGSSNLIDCISYQTGKNSSYFLYPS